MSTDTGLPVAPHTPLPKRGRERGTRSVISNVTYYTVMTLASLLFLVPLVWMVLSSFKTQAQIFDSPFSLPTSIDFGNWTRAWNEGNLGRYAINSILVTTASVFAILVFGAMAAFALSRLKFRSRGLLLVILALGLLLPVQSYFVAQSTILNRLDITNTRWALIIPYIGLGISLSVYLLKAYMDSLPRELFECARIDGCGDVRMFFAILLPLLKPGLATVGTFSVLAAWNEFLLATLYIQSDDLKTIPVGLVAFTGKYATDYPLLFSALSIVTIPMIGIYVIFHRQVIQGITEGTTR